MSLEIASGVNLKVIPSDKFKTTQITIRFLAPLTRNNINQRSLLAKILENSSQKYPTPKELNEILAELYGATFSVDVRRRGQVHELSFNIRVINDKYINMDNDIIMHAFAFLKEVIFNPVLEGHKFNLSIVSREKQQLIKNIASIKDDKQDYALIQLQDLYFEDKSQEIPIFGSEDEIESITADDLYHVYQDMIYNDLVSIIVVGDTKEKQIEQYVKLLNFADRNNKQLNYKYVQSVRPDYTINVDQENLAQSKLAMAYNTSIYFGDLSYYSLLVFNGLFGGFPHSKLFMNIREKESLAYYASSMLDNYRGYLIVQSGIAKENKDKVIELIKQQLKDLASGEFSDGELNQTKEMLIGQFLNKLDQPQFLKEIEILNQMYPKWNYSKKEYIKNIKNVTKKDIQAIAKQVKLQSIYILEGSE